MNMFQNLLKKYIKRGIKLFDLIIVLIFLFILFSLFFVLFRSTKEIKITVRVNELYPNNTDPAMSTLWRSNLFYKGMSEKNTLGKTQTEVLRVFKYDNRPENPVVYLILKLKAIYNRGTGLYVYKGKNILVGNAIPLVLDGVMTQAMIVNIEGVAQRYPKKKLIIKTELTNVENHGVLPYFVDKIPQNELIKDSQGQTVLRILKKEVYNAKKIVNTDNGEIFLSEDPFRKDVYLTFEITVQKINDRYYFFDDNPILIGQTIPVEFKLIPLYPTIVSIEEIKDESQSGK